MISHGRGDHDILRDAAAVIDALDAEEIQRRIDWLEEALAIYRTLATVKAIHERRPPALALPDPRPLTIPLTDLDETARGRAPRRSPQEMIELVSNCLAGGVPRRASEIAAHVGCRKGTIDQHLARFANKLYLRVGPGLWTLRRLRPAMEGSPPAAAAE